MPWALEYELRIAGVGYNPEPGKRNLPGERLSDSDFLL
jgi:hypothetical protein